MSCKAFMGVDVGLISCMIIAPGWKPQPNEDAIAPPSAGLVWGPLEFFMTTTNKVVPVINQRLVMAQLNLARMLADKKLLECAQIHLDNGARSPNAALRAAWLELDDRERETLTAPPIGLDWKEHVPDHRQGRRDLLHEPKPTHSMAAVLQPEPIIELSRLDPIDMRYAVKIAVAAVLAVQAEAAPAAVPTPAPAPKAPPPAPETAEQRQERRLRACLDAGLKIDFHSTRLPDGVGAVAFAEGVSRQTFSADVKAAIARHVERERTKLRPIAKR